MRDLRNCPRKTIGAAARQCRRPALTFPPDGALVDQFDENGALLDQVEQQKRVFAQMLRREVENTVIDARRAMTDDPGVAGHSS